MKFLPKGTPVGLEFRVEIPSDQIYNHPFVMVDVISNFELRVDDKFVKIYSTMFEAKNRGSVVRFDLESKQAVQNPDLETCIGIYTNPTNWVTY